MPRHLISDAHDLNGELSAEFGLAQAISRRSAVCAPLHPYFEYLSVIIQMREFTLALGLAARINTKRDNGKWDAWTGGYKVVQTEARVKIQMREFTLALGLAAKNNTQRDNGK